MKKTAFFISVIMLILSLTGCGEKSNKDLSAVYIPVRYEFFSPRNMQFFQDGKAYEDTINDKELDEEIKLWCFNSLCFNGNKIEQFDYDNMRKDYYSGEYKIAKDGKLDLTYNYYEALKEDGGAFYFDLKNNDTNMESLRQKDAIESKLMSMNVCDYVGNTIYGWNYDDKTVWLPAPYITSADSGEIDSVVRTNYHGGWANLYHKGDFFVSEQKGYSFDGKICKKQFTLKYDANEIGKPEFAVRYNCEINFNSDNTWECVREENIPWCGTWEIIHDNLLVIYPSEDDVNFGFGTSMLYLDFNEGKVYLPAYMQCDEMNKIYRAYKSQTTNEH